MGYYNRDQFSSRIQPHTVPLCTSEVYCMWLNVPWMSHDDNLMHLLEGFLRFHLHEGCAFDVPCVSMSRHVHLSGLLYSWSMLWKNSDTWNMVELFPMHFANFCHRKLMNPAWHTMKYYEGKSSGSHCSRGARTTSPQASKCACSVVSSALSGKPFTTTVWSSLP